MAKSTSIQKINEITRYGGECFLVDSTDLIYAESERLAKELNGYYMDQFTNAERATDWRGNNNIADSIFQQMKNEPHPVPSHLVMSAGTGGTSATLGRYIRYHQLDTELTVVDPEHSVFYDYFLTGNRTLTESRCGLIEGIGRPRVEPSFIAPVIDCMMRISDKESIATMLWLEKLIGRRVGASTGTNMMGVLKIAKKMHQKGQTGSIVTLLCDRGERYANSYYDKEWVAKYIGDISEQSLSVSDYLSTC